MRQSVAVAFVNEVPAMSQRECKDRIMVGTVTELAHCRRRAKCDFDFSGYFWVTLAACRTSSSTLPNKMAPPFWQGTTGTGIFRFFRPH
jgi:hypothetical protein